MFEEISGKLSKIVRNLTGKGRLSEENIASTLREIRRALLEADVDYRVSKEFVERVKEAALGQEILRSLTPGQQVVKVVHDELRKLMGGESQEIDLSAPSPVIIMLAGLQGSGKTTLAGKLAYHFKKRGRRPMLVAADVYRPAAVLQLRVLAEEVEVGFFSADNGADVVQICRQAVEKAEETARDVVILDTAGRLHIDDAMMEELEAIAKAVTPREIILVADAMTGQDAVNIAREFSSRLDLTGVALTKMDGDARGGAALSIREITGRPIKFVSVGEKLDALEKFHPDRMASRILGMGDVLTLVEKAQETVDLEEAQKLEERLRKQTFTMQDFLQQLRQVRKMGSLTELAGMIPGLDSIAPQEVDEKELVHVEAMILSMTPAERMNPDIIDGSRRKRIARGSGTTVQDVNRLLKQFSELKSLIKTMTGGGTGKGKRKKMKQVPFPFRL